MNFKPVFSIEDAPFIKEQISQDVLKAYNEFISQGIFASQLGVEEFKSNQCWFRIPEHFRSEYYQLENGVLCFKGNTFLKDNFFDFLKYFNQRKFRGGQLNIFERFPPLEHKVPGLLLKHEAELELAKALDLQKNYLNIFGELAPTTIPLGVYALAPTEIEDLAKVFSQVGKKHTQSLIEHLISQGVYFSISYYQGTPYRAFDYHKKHIPENILGNLKMTQTVDLWLENFAKLLHSGFLSGTLHSRGLGHPFDFGNLAIDGGYFDLGSLYELSDIESESEFHLYLGAIFKSLSLSISNVMRSRQEGSHNFIYECSLYQHFLKKFEDFQSNKSRALAYKDSLKFDDLSKLLASWKLNCLQEKI